MDLVSVIIPVYKVEPYLDRCVQSVVDQTFTNLEIILIDDGSPDNCPVMCDAWAEKDSRIRVIHKDNGGVSSARNAGIQNASGHFLFFLDGDDAIIQDAILYLIKCQRLFSSDIVIAGHKVLSDQSTFMERPASFDQVQKRQISLDEYFRSGMKKRWITGRLIRRDYATEVLFDEDVSHGEDSIYFLKLLMNKTPSFSVLECPLYLYFVRNSSASAGTQGLVAFFYVGKWCADNWDKFCREIQGKILLEGLKNLFIFRYEFRQDKEYPFAGECAHAIQKSVFILWGEENISISLKTIYTILAVFPKLYSLYVERKNNH